ncbi:MAG: T9SS type A sorting domain-containing protein [Bacteroidota bacterium]
MRNLNTKTKNREPINGSSKQKSFIFKNLFLIFAIIISINMKVMAQDTLSVIPYNYVAAQRYQANAICHSSLDFYWMAGQTDTLGATNSNVFLFELDPNNNMDTVRTRIFNFYKDDVAYDIKETYDGNLLICGFESNTGTKDAMYFLTDTTGTLLWSKALGFTAYEDVFYSSTITPYDSGAAFVGYCKNISSGSQAACLLKTNQYGDTMWFKKYFGSPGENIAYSVCNTWDKGFLLAGNCMGSDGFRKIYIVRTDSAGTELWSKTIGDSLITTVARKILITRTYDIVIAGSLDSSALFMYLSPGGNFKYGTTFKYASANSLIATDSGYYIISGTTFPVASNPPRAWVMYLNELGDSLITYTDTTGSSSICTNFVFDVGRNGFVACGAYHQTGTVATYSAIFTLPHYIGSSWSMAGLCPVWYDRAIRLPYTHSNGPNDNPPGPGDNYFLKSIFDWDDNNNGIQEQKTFLDWLQKNHITKLIIDGIYYPSLNTSNCNIAPNPSMKSILDDVYNDGTHPNNVCHYCDKLSSFISAARVKGVTKVYATIHHMEEELNGATAVSDSEIVRIAEYNKRSNYSSSTGKIDGYWIDYEFWANYCNGFSTSGGTNCCGDSYYSNITSHALHQATYGALNNFTEFGFKQFKHIIASSETARIDVNNWYNSINSNCSTCKMIKSEVLIEPNFNFNVDESGGKPPFIMELATYYNAYISAYQPIDPFPFINTGGWEDGTYTTSAATASLAQGFIFAKWLEDPNNNIGSIAIDFSVADSRDMGSVDECSGGPTDHNYCDTKSPDHFLDAIIATSPNNSHCPPTAYPSPLNPTDHPMRQRILDFLGSFARTDIPIWPYFGAENYDLDVSNLLGNFMLGDDANSHTSNTGIPNYYSYLSLCNASSLKPSIPHYLPDIHNRFMQQYKNSWSESFCKVISDNRNGYHTIYNEHGQPSEDTYVYNTYGLHFDYHQHGGFPNLEPPLPYWGGYTGTNTHTQFVIGGMEWFPMNSFPLSLDNTFPTTSYGVNRVDAFSPSYPSTSQPPLMQLLNTSTASYADRTYDSYNDMWISCAAYNAERKANPNKTKVKNPKIVSADMYPNPSDGKYILTYQLSSLKGTIFITDLSNRTVFSQILSNSLSNINIDLSLLNNGIYYWHVVDDNGIYETGRITLLK